MSRTSLKTNHVLVEAVKHWKYVAPILIYPKNERDYNMIVKRLDELLDIVGDDEKHPLNSLIDILSNFIAVYEAKHLKKPKSKGIDALKFLIDSNQLRQTDFPEIASQGVISEILNGKRKLNLKQIKLFAKRFNVDPMTFVDE